MPIRSDFSYSAEISAYEGPPIQTLELAEPDWEPALQWSYFQQVRAGARSPVMRCADGTVEPVWDEELGRPFVAALRIAPGSGRRRARPAYDIPNRYLRGEVETAAARLVSAGRLTAGEPFRYRILARPRSESGSAGPEDSGASGIEFERLAQPLLIGRGSLGERLAGGAANDHEHADAIDLRVMMAPSVLEAAIALARTAPGLETGGVLVGGLQHDDSGSELFLDVQALLPARHAVSQPDRLTFTADTWADAHAALALRGRGESLVGWMHSHPHFCAKCPPEAQRRCLLARPFLSEHDRALHRAVFGRPFDVALLVTDHGAAGHSCALFGWRRGLIERRGYHLSGAAPHMAATGPLPNDPDNGATATSRKPGSQRSCGES